MNLSNSLIENAKYLSEVNDFAPHAHNCYEIIYLKEGSLKVAIGEKQYDAKGPSLIFVSKLEQHSLKVTGNAYKRYYLCISPAGAGSLIRDYTLLTLLSNRHEDFCHVLNAAPFEAEADRIFKACVAEQEAGLPYSAERQASLLCELLILIYRQNPALFSSENNKSISIIWKIQCRFEQNYQEKFSLRLLAEEYHMSPCYLSHLFKSATGYSIMQYLTMCRLSVSRQLLSETDMSVTEIVYATGFSDSSNFSRLFKREMACSPLEYRKHQQTERISL